MRTQIEEHQVDRQISDDDDSLRHSRASQTQGVEMIEMVLKSLG